MNYSLRIAYRYIFTKRSFHFITVISIISLVGIVIGVAALIAVMSIFNGFREFTENQLIGFDPHLRIIAKEGAWIYNSNEIAKKILRTQKSLIPRKIKNVESIIQGRVLAIKGNNMQVFTVNAINTSKLKKVSDIEKKMIAGIFYTGLYGNLPTIVLGSGISYKLKALPGDTLSLSSPKLIEKSIKTFRMPSQVQVVVAGIFETNTKDFDDIYAFANVETGEQLFSSPDNVASSLDIKLYNIEDAESVKTEITKILPQNTEVMTWYQLHKQLYDVMNFERKVAFIIMSLIVIIAVFNVLASLTMTVVEKKRDIGILKTMGASEKGIRNIFVFQGTIIGIISTFLGIILGLSFCYCQIKYGWFKLDASNLLITAIPVSVNFIDVMIITIFSLILSFLAAIYPAKRAASTMVIESIRTE